MFKNPDEFIKENKNKLNKEYRLNYHFMGEYGWINDPNGFIYYKGHYHLFYQHYPYEAKWGPMHWGHAKSKDLIKWDYLPIALKPDKPYDIDGCFSGSSIIKDDKLYLIYTGHKNLKENFKDYMQVQCIAYSNDGINFYKYNKNPVIKKEDIPEYASKKDFRDPKVFKIGDFYYAIIGSQHNDSGQLLLYKSKDLFNWEFVNYFLKGDCSFGKCYECPDIFKLGDKYILIFSPQFLKLDYFETNIHSSVYMIGDFDIEKGVFIPESYDLIDYGFDFYAPQTTDDPQGRRIMIAWLNMWETEQVTMNLGHNWSGAMTLPRQLVLNNNKIKFKPIESIKKYRRNYFNINSLDLEGDYILNTFGDSYELKVLFDRKDSLEFGVKLRCGENEETKVHYDTKERELVLDRDKSGIGLKGEKKVKYNLINNKLELNIFVDKSSVEVFVDDGNLVLTSRIYPSKDSKIIKLYSKGMCRILNLDKWDIIT